MDVLKIRVVRNNFENSLTKSQRLHQSETDLDNYPNFDIYLYSDSGIDNLNNVVREELFTNNVFSKWLFG